MTGRIDPTGLADVRAVMRRETDRRWTALRRHVRRAIVGRDALAVGPTAPSLARPTAEKAHAFHGWLSEQMSSRVGAAWIDPYLATAADRAASRVGRLVGVASSAPSSLPVCRAATALHAGRIAEDAAREAHTAVAAQLLANPQSRKLAHAADAPLARAHRRARVLAEHAATQVYTQASLDAYEAAGVSRVGSVAEHRHATADVATMSKAEARYRDPPSPYAYAGEECATCSMFIDGGRCTLVEGVIAPSGWCDQWEKAKVSRAAGILHVDPDGNGLFLHRTDGEGWALPGGGLEPGEDPEHAAVRETLEECGGAPTTGPLSLLSVSSGPVEFHTFRRDVPHQFEPMLNHEHDAHVWASLSSPPEPLHPGVAWTLRTAALVDAAEGPWEPPGSPVDAPNAIGAGRYPSPARDHDHDVPELSCMSADGRTFYWDRRLPEYTLIAGAEAHVPALLDANEVAELEDVRGRHEAYVRLFGREPDEVERVAIYNRAHEAEGLPAERAEAARQGIDWRKWNDWCGAKYEEIRRQPVSNPVPDPHVRPVPHSRGDYAETLDAADPPWWRSLHSGKFTTKAHRSALDPDAEWEGPEEEDVSIQTAEDDLVCRTCEDIAADGPYDIMTARDLIPAHLNCRCVFVPA